MTEAELRKLPAGTLVRWIQDGAEPTLGRVRFANPGNKRAACWIEWEDGQRTDAYDDWALGYVVLEAL